MQHLTAAHCQARRTSIWQQWDMLPQCEGKSVVIQSLQNRPVIIAQISRRTEALAPRRAATLRSADPRAPQFFGGRSLTQAHRLQAPRPSRRGLECQAIGVGPILQALPAIGGATAGAVVGVPAAIIAAVITSGLSKTIDGSINKGDKLSTAGFAATVGVQAVVLMAHMTTGAVLTCALFALR